MRAMAERFPTSTPLLDTNRPLTAAARAQRRVGGLPTPPSGRPAARELPLDARYDLVLTLDCMHDVPFPDRVASAIRRCLKEGRRLG